MSTFKVYSPYDLSEIAELAYNTAEEVEHWLQTAHDLHKKGPLPKPQRIAILEKATKLLTDSRESFAETIAKEGAKPLTDALVEADRAVAGIHNAIEVLKSETGREIPMGINAASEGRMAYTRKEPIGPVVAVSAFNHPLNLIVHQAIPAVATGCPVIVKPAETTPLSCIGLVELLYEAGLPEEWCQVALLTNEDSEKLVTDPRVAFFTFIGSARVGWMLRSKLAPGTRCALEHGGAAPVIVAQDADYEAAIAPLVKGGYYHAGQVCVSVQRIFVHEAIFEDFKNKYVQAVSNIKVGDPLEVSTEAGPLILPREVERVHQWVAEAIEVGAECPVGGSTISETVYSPTVLVNPSPDAKVSTQEIFGPVTCLYSYSDSDDAIERANSLDVAFQASVFTSSLDQSIYFSERLDAAAVMVNDHTAFRVDWMPFAGRRTSGHGTGGIPYTMEDMWQDKMVVIKSSAIR